MSIEYCRWCGRAFLSGIVTRLCASYGKRRCESVANELEPSHAHGIPHKAERSTKTPARDSEAPVDARTPTSAA